MLPLHSTVLKILSLNGHQFTQKIHTQLYNNQIKEIVKMADIDIITKVRIRKNFRTTTQLVNKWKAMSSHIGRQSFASNFFGKIPTALLMEATGHSSEKMFMRYINPIDTERTLFLSNYLEEAYKNKYHK